MQALFLLFSPFIAVAGSQSSLAAFGTSLSEDESKESESMEVAGAVAQREAFFAPFFLRSGKAPFPFPFESGFEEEEVVSGFWAVMRFEEDSTCKNPVTVNSPLVLREDSEESSPINSRVKDPFG